MLRKIGLSLLCAGTLFATASTAMTHDLTASLSADYDLEVNKAERFTNYTMFEVKAVCTIQSIDEDDVIHVKALKNSGTLNGEKMKAGDSLDIDVHNGVKLTLSAKPAAEVELTNTGEHTVKAKCKTV